MSLRKRVEKIENDIYPTYHPFVVGHKKTEGLKKRVRDLEEENEKLWDNIKAILNYFNLEKELVREHLKLKKKKK